LIGRSASYGKARGKARIVDLTEVGPLQRSDLCEEGEVLVCEMTTPDFLPLMKKAVAIVTDLGGSLSHAAIVAREFGIPCVVATERATKILKNGDVVEVDAELGIVRIL
jgi:pyruvate,water dikinase